MIYWESQCWSYIPKKPLQENGRSNGLGLRSWMLATLVLVVPKPWNVRPEASTWCVDSPGVMVVTPLPMGTHVFLHFWGVITYNPIYWGFKTFHFSWVVGVQGYGGIKLDIFWNFEGVRHKKCTLWDVFYDDPCSLWWLLQGTDTYPTLGKGNSSWRDLLLEEFRLTHHLGCKKTL